MSSMSETAYETHGLSRMSHSARSPLPLEWDSERPKTEEQEAEDMDMDVMIEDPSPFAEDMYGLFTAIFVRDLHFMGQSEKGNGGSWALRLTRIMSSLFFLGVTIAMQGFFLYKVRFMVTPEKVKSIREQYSAYQQHMYPAMHTHQLSTGFWRGNGQEYMNYSAFATLADEAKDVVCYIGLSQPDYFFMILLVWTITIASEVKQQMKWWYCIMVQTSTTWCPCFGGMERCFKQPKEQPKDAEGSPPDVLEIEMLPIGVKFLLAVFVGIPRFLISSFLLWLGCRWLCATTGFGDLLLNAVALEFVVAVKELIFVALIPYRTKKDVATTLMPPFHGTMNFNMVAGVGAVFWATASVVWVYLYMFHYQTVLPDYQFDIHSNCQSYLAEKFDISATSHARHRHHRHHHNNTTILPVLGGHNTTILH